jgi:hypothetical protein
MSGGAADFYKAVDDFLRNASYNLTFFDAGEGLPKVVEAVKRGAAFCDGASRITFDLYQCGLGALTGSGQSCYDARGAGTCYDDVEFPYRQFFRWLLIKTVKLISSALLIAFCEGSLSANSKHQHLFIKISTIHFYLLFLNFITKGSESDFLYYQISDFLHDLIWEILGQKALLVFHKALFL